MEASARRTLIILALVAAVLVAAFFAAVVCRSDGGGSGSGLSADWRERWRERLLPGSPVAPGQLGGCAAAPGPFTIAGRCDLRIAPAAARSRRLVLTAVDPVGLSRTVDADGRRLAMRAELAAGESARIFVDKAGEAIALRCLAGPACRARLDSPGP